MNINIKNILIGKNNIMERVTVINGKRPILLFAPHGFNGDDENTGLITKHIADILNCYAVINNGWERSENVDSAKDKADCNNVEHCHQDVVKDEILDPLLRCYHKIKRVHPTAFIFNIHGMSNKHRKIAENDKLDIVVGYGAGNPNSYTCDLWRKNCFIYLLHKAGLTVYEGKKGGSMSGWARNNMNQLFRKWYPAANAQSMQLEIIYELRQDKDMALLCAEYLAAAMLDLISSVEFTKNVDFNSY